MRIKHTLLAGMAVICAIGTGFASGSDAQPAPQLSAKPTAPISAEPASAPAEFKRAPIDEFIY